MGTFGVCALENTKEHEDEIRNPISTSTSELMSVPLAKLASPNLLQQLKEIDIMMCDVMNKRDSAPLSGESESPQQWDVGVQMVVSIARDSRGRATIIIDSGAVVLAMPEEMLPNVPHCERAENEFCRVTRSHS